MAYNCGALVDQKGGCELSPPPRRAEPDGAPPARAPNSQPLGIALLSNRSVL